MNILLIVRLELVCAAILSFLLFVSLRYWRNEEKKRFLRMCSYALGHVIFDAVTVCTVNHPEVVPRWVNDVLHMIFYEFAILFCYEFFCYVMDNTFSYSTASKIAKWCRIVPCVFPLMLPVLGIDYLHGNGTMYSFGPIVFLGYGTVTVFFLIGFVMVLFNRNMDTATRWVMVPMLFAMLIAVMVQMVIPELLFTGADVTLVVVALFLALENPIDKYRQRAYYDMGTGLRNRNGYEDDLARISARNQKKNGAMKLAYVMCDLNGLKYINDTYGHVAGDNYIRTAGQYLKAQLKHAYRIYRIGGDEFAAFYLDEAEAAITEEVAMVRKNCRNVKTSDGIPLAIAIGYAVLENGKELTDMIMEADKRMYEHKSEMKAENRDYARTEKR